MPEKRVFRHVVLRFLILSRGLGSCGGVDGAGGANSLARATFDALVGVDFVDVAFGDCFNGAFGQTCAASHADVGDNVSHGWVCFRNYFTKLVLWMQM